MSRRRAEPGRAASERKVKPISQNLRCNEQIRLSPVRVVDAAGNQFGVLPTAQALQMAREAGLDLVEVAPHDRPPVCRIMDYGKFKYSLKKKSKKHHHEQQMKEVRLRPKTDTHDRMIKVKHAIDFLKDGDKVQFTMKFRGRERAHREVAFQAFNQILGQLGPYVKVDRPPSMEGRDMIMILSPNKQALEALKTEPKAGEAKAGEAAKPGEAKPGEAKPGEAAKPADAKAGAAAGAKAAPSPGVAPGPREPAPASAAPAGSTAPAGSAVAAVSAAPHLASQA